MSGRAPVAEWREFLLQVADSTKPVLYLAPGDDGDLLGEDTLRMQTLLVMPTLPRLSAGTLRNLAYFVANDTSPGMSTRFSADTKKALAGGRLTLADAAFVIAYAHTFCSGLMMERVYIPSDADSRTDSRGTTARFAARPTDLTFALDSMQTDGMHCLVSIKHDQREPYKLVVLMYQITRDRYNSSGSPPNSTRLRIEAASFDTRVETDTTPDLAMLRSLYQDGSSRSIGAGDTVYELVRELYSDYYGTNQKQINLTAIVDVLDGKVADRVTTEGVRGAWFCTTLEWLSQPRVAEALEANLLFSDVVSQVRREYQFAAKTGFGRRPPRLHNSRRLPLPTPNQPQVQKEARQRLFTAVQAAIGGLVVSSATVYYWCSILDDKFWDPMAHFLWIDFDNLSGVKQHDPDTAYFDSPYTAVARQRRSAPAPIAVPLSERELRTVALDETTSSERPVSPAWADPEPSRAPVQIGEQVASPLSPSSPTPRKERGATALRSDSPAPTQRVSPTPKDSARVSSSVERTQGPAGSDDESSEGVVDDLSQRSKKLRVRARLAIH